MFGHPTLPASHPDRIPLALALATFGGRGMTATLMDEVRTKRGLAYGAYMSLASRRGPGAVRGWVFTSVKRTVTTLKLVLRLYRQLRKEGIADGPPALLPGLRGRGPRLGDGRSRAPARRAGDRGDARPARRRHRHLRRAHPGSHPGRGQGRPRAPPRSREPGHHPGCHLRTSCARCSCARASPRGPSTWSPSIVLSLRRRSAPCGRRPDRW